MQVSGKCHSTGRSGVAGRIPLAVAKREEPDYPVSPDACRHGRIRRLGIQKADVWPFRLHLVTCAGCGTTLTTETLRGLRKRERAPRTPDIRLRA